MSEADPKARLAALVAAAVREAFPQAGEVAIEIERTKSAEHGDFASNVAIKIAKAVGLKPREAAQAIVAALPASGEIAKTEIAGPGVINFTNIDKDNFNQVLGEQDLGLHISVPDVLSGEPGSSLDVKLKFKSLADFGPERVAEQVPELKKLLELRQAITALKGPLGNVPAFKRKIEALLKDDAARDKLIAELGLSKDGG